MKCRSRSLGHSLTIKDIFAAEKNSSLLFFDGLTDGWKLELLCYTLLQAGVTKYTARFMTLGYHVRSLKGPISIRMNQKQILGRETLHVNL